MCVSNTFCRQTPSWCHCNLLAGMSLPKAEHCTRLWYKVTCFLELYHHPHMHKLSQSMFRTQAQGGGRHTQIGHASLGCAPPLAPSSPSLRHIPIRRTWTIHWGEGRDIPKGWRNDHKPNQCWRAWTLSFPGWPPPWSPHTHTHLCHPFTLSHCHFRGICIDIRLSMTAQVVVLPVGRVLICECICASSPPKPYRP